MARKNLVVVGASLAGLRAVEAARNSGFDGSITLVGAEEHLPYDRPPLSKAYLDWNEPGAEPESTTFRTESALREDMNVRLVLGRKATGLDIERKRVLLDGTSLDYDALVLATGARARTFPGSERLRGVHTLRTLDDAVAVRSALDEGARTVVIGAGFIGSEVAAGARKRGLDVTVVEASPTPLARAVGSAMGSACVALHHRNGTDLRCGVGVDAIEGERGVERVVLSDGTAIPADLVVVGIGADPCTEWLEGSGLRLDDGVLCDQHLSAGADGVFAAGDVVRWHNALFDRPMRLEHWTSAAEQGAVAARNAIDPGSAKAYQTVPYFWSDWYDSRIQFVGVPDADEVRIVEGDPVRDERVVALYRRGDRLVGVLTINGQNVIMKYRALIMKRTCWDDANTFAESRARVRAQSR
ncbi:NAD(P)/FAD-dependent oxidoreductase [Sciscionella sediminilitoris]|uniref:NAD(P)/FAD-dependent oxidoreductase n=1 Tax=Sciscionella sediminilitoris TaxID=1445613 RepID=UPI0004DEFCD2|nr:FAD-dependent oxidoreductase [Sciscionella sp. SE31]